MIVDQTYALDLMTDVTRAVWLEDDSTALDRFFHPHAVISGVMPGIDLTVADYRVLAEQLQLVLEINGFDITECICGAGGRVAYRMHLDTTLRGSGARAPQDFANFCLFEGEKVVHSTVLTDQFSFFERAGVIDANMRLSLLAG